MAHGVRKVNEYLVRDGRTLILTQNVATGISQAQWDNISDGTLYLAPSTGDLKFKKKGNEPRVWTKFLPENLFDDLTITGNFLADRTILEPKMADDSISTRTIIDRSVTSLKIEKKAILTEHFTINDIDGAIIKDTSLNGSKLIDNTVDAAKITDRTIEAVKIAQGTITDFEIGSNAIRRGHILDGEVVESKLATDSVTKKKIKDLEVTTDKLDNNAVTYEKLGLKSVDWNTVRDNAIRRNHILDEEVVESKLATGAVTRNKIADLEVTTAKLATNAVTTEKVTNKHITLAKLEDSVQTIIRNAVVHDGTYATVKSSLKVQGNIVADPGDLSRSITGFKVYNPLFADYAEGFVPAETLEVGDIVEIDDHKAVKKADSYSRKVVGVVSDRYGFCLDASKEELENGAKVAIGLMGKVPVKVVGQVEAGDFIISSGDGVGIATQKFFPGAIIGKALESKKTYGLGKVLCLIQPM